MYDKSEIRSQDHEKRKTLRKDRARVFAFIDPHRIRPPCVLESEREKARYLGQFDQKRIYAKIAQREIFQDIIPVYIKSHVIKQHHKVYRKTVYYYPF